MASAWFGAVKDRVVAVAPAFGGTASVTPDPQPFPAGLPLTGVNSTVPLLKPVPLTTIVLIGVPPTTAAVCGSTSVTATGTR
jgi:hypothetical protein